MLFLCLRQGSGLSDLVGLDFEVNIPTKFSSMFIDTDMFVILNKAKAQFDSITSPCPCERRQFLFGDLPISFPLAPTSCP